MKKANLIIALFVIGVLVAVSVYAITAFDTDGGYNPDERGVCVDNYGNHTDYCSSNDVLREYYPVYYTNATANISISYCTNVAVTCPGAKVCQNGACGYPS